MGTSLFASNQASANVVDFNYVGDYSGPFQYLADWGIDRDSGRVLAIPYYVSVYNVAYGSTTLNYAGYGTIASGGFGQINFWYFSQLPGFFQTVGSFPSVDDYLFPWDGGSPSFTPGIYQLLGGTLTITDVMPPVSVPEPAGWALMLLGIGCVGAVLRRSRRLQGAITIA